MNPMPYVEEYLFVAVTCLSLIVNAALLCAGLLGKHAYWVITVVLCLVCIAMAVVACM